MLTPQHAVLEICGCKKSSLRCFLVLKAPVIRNPACNVRCVSDGIVTLHDADESSVGVASHAGSNICNG